MSFLKLQKILSFLKIQKTKRIQINQANQENPENHAVHLNIDLPDVSILIRHHYLLPQINRNPVNDAPIIEAPLIENKNEALVNENNEVFEKLMERRRCRIDEKKKKKKKRFGEFVNSLTEEEYTACDLQTKYNTFFYVVIIPIRLGRMIEIKNHIEKSR